MEIAQALKNYPELRVRMGVHSGPVNEISDLNEQANIAGAGINIAQRVMDCGDAGHILLSRHVAEDLEHYPRWQAHLHDLGECEVKHGIRISVVNLYNNEIGNPALPEKFRQAKAKGQAAPGLWVAVLPFRGAGDAEMESFADGLREEITTGLSRFRYLSVVASASAARLKGEAGDERALGAKLGARYVLQGSIRKGGSGIRVSAQLVDTQTGAQLWAETYNRDLQTSTIFAAQDDVAARIVATVADSYGVLVHSMREATRQKDDVDLTPAEWQFQCFAYREQITPSNHAALKSRLERAVKRDDRQSDLWACLAQIYCRRICVWLCGRRDLARSGPNRGPSRSRIGSGEPVRHGRASADALLPPGSRGVWSCGRARDGSQSAEHRRGRDPGTADRAHRRVRARHRDR